jgi:hypothetical protein
VRDAKSPTGWLGMYPGGHRARAKHACRGARHHEARCPEPIGSQHVGPKARSHSLLFAPLLLSGSQHEAPAFDQHDEQRTEVENRPGAYRVLTVASRDDLKSGLSAGAAREIRTPDPIITNDVLYQLSYCGLVERRHGGDAFERRRCLCQFSPSWQYASPRRSRRRLGTRCFHIAA